MKVKFFQDYSTQAVASALGNLGRMGGDKYLSSVNPDELIERYYDQYSLPRLILLSDGRPRNIVEQARSDYSGSGTAKITIRYDVEEAPRIEKSLTLMDKNEPSSIFQNDTKGLYIQEDLSPESVQKRIDNLSEQVQTEVKRKNLIIDSTNTDFRSRIAAIIAQRHSKLNLQKETIAKLAELIPIEFRTEPTSPLVPLNKKKEIIINPPRTVGTVQSRVDPRILNAIIDILIRGGRTFETTPQTFVKLQEEDLRNLLIAFLNGNFEIRAVGEAFNRRGKTDISFPYSGDNLFVAECKFWGGPKSYQEALDQLFTYLTWRQSIGVLVFFVKERDFSSVIEKAKEATRNHSTFVAGTLTIKDASYLLSTHRFPNDATKQVTVHHLLFHIPDHTKLVP